jgi:hypothetical protein
MQKRQLPGRIEALRLVLGGNSTPELLQLAGMRIKTAPRPPSIPSCAQQFSAHLETLTQAERKALPF